jgi:hypothetical protein
VATAAKRSQFEVNIKRRINLRPVKFACNATGPIRSNDLI